MSVIVRFSNLSIRTKLIAGFATLLLLMAVQGFIAIQKFTAMNSSVEELTSNYMLAINYLSDMRSDILKYRLVITKTMLRGETGEQLDASLKTMDRLRERLKTVEAKYAQTVTTAREHDIYERYTTGWTAYLEAGQRAIALLRAGRASESTATMDQVAALGAKVDMVLDEDVKFNSDGGMEWGAKAAADYQSGRLIVLVLIGVATVMTIAIISLSVIVIARPVRDMTEAMRRLAENDIAVEIPAQGRTDEVGRMAAAVAVFRANIIKADRLAAAEKSALAVRARRTAALDNYTQTFGDTVAGVMAALATAAEAMISASKTMETAANSVHTEAEGTANSASRSAQDLIALSAAVEEMSASVNEISRQVATAAEVARQAVERADNSNVTMQSLTSAATKIGDVVRLISQIAGQTNLLALNATIEAARAGDAGKGFAVVAGEVKALASQTAKATVEISDQIGTVSAATTEAVTAMNEIRGIIARLDQVAAAISAAVEQQSATTREIATSIQTVSSVTSTTAGAMAQVVSAAEGAARVSRDIESGANDITRQSNTLRTEVDGFLTAVRTETGERRQEERLKAGGEDVRLRVDGQTVIAKLNDISRSGALFRTEMKTVVGNTVEIELPFGAGAVTGRVVRQDGLGLAVAFAADPALRGRIDRVLQALKEGQLAA